MGWRHSWRAGGDARLLPNLFEAQERRARDYTLSVATRVTAEETVTLDGILVGLGPCPRAREVRELLEATYGAVEQADRELHEFVT